MLFGGTFSTTLSDFSAQLNFQFNNMCTIIHLHFEFMNGLKFTSEAKPIR